MAYQNPSYCFLHAAADAGAASMFASDNGTGTPDREDPDYPLENLVDYRPSSLFKFSAGDTNNAVYIDRGAGTLDNITWFIIPPGHNLATAGICLVESDTTSAWAAPNTRASWTQNGESDPDGIITKATETFNDRYVRFRVNAPSTAWEIGQIWLTDKRTPSTAAFDPVWTEQQVSTTVHVPFPSRDASLSLAGNRWQYTLTYHHLDGTDLAVFDDLIEEVGIDLLPFYFFPPDDTTPTGPLLVKIAPGSYTRQQERRVPQAAAGAGYRVSFTLLEQIA